MVDCSVLILGGFQVPAEQYGVYARRLQVWAGSCSLGLCGAGMRLFESTDPLIVSTHQQEAGVARVRVRADGNTFDNAAAAAAAASSDVVEGDAVAAYEAEAVGIAREILKEQQQGVGLRLVGVW